MRHLFDIKSGLFPWPIAVVGAFIVVLQLGWRPYIMSDEVTYSHAALHESFWEARHGQYLFSLLHSPGAFLGDYFYLYSQLINLLFWVASAVMVFYIAKRFVGVGLAIVISCLHLIMPASFYASSFMPEAPLAFFVLSAIYFAIRAEDEEFGPLHLGLLFASLLFASMTKAHGSVFVVYVLIAGLLIFVFSRNKAWLFVSLASFLAILSRAIFGWLTGEQAPFVFGVYNRRATQPDSREGTQIISAGEQTLTAQLLDSASAHLGYLLLVVPLVAASVLMGKVFRDATSFLVVGSLGIMFILAIYYHATTVLNGEAIVGTNLSRYFEFLLPISIAPAIALMESSRRLWASLVVSLAAVAGTALVFLNELPGQTVANSALGSVLGQNSWFLAVPLSISIILIMVFWSHAKPWKLSGLVLAPLFLLSLTFQINGSTEFRQLSYWDVAGKDLRTLTNAYGHVDLLIVTSNKFVGFTAGFYANNPNFVVSPNDWCIREGECQPDFVLYMENLGPQEPMNRIIENEDYRIFQPIY
mgnify:CR=1 FL=1